METTFRENTMSLNQQLNDACELGELAKVQQFVEKGADIQCWDNSALFWASFHGHLDVVKFLVSKGADIQRCGEESKRCAKLNGHTEVVNYLIQALTV